MNPYSILGIGPKFSDEELAKAFRTYVKKWHPDINPDPDAIVKFRLGVEAYEKLMGKTVPRTLRELIKDLELEIWPYTGNRGKGNQRTRTKKEEHEEKREVEKPKKRKLKRNDYIKEIGDFIPNPDKRKLDNQLRHFRQRKNDEKRKLDNRRKRLLQKRLDKAVP